MTKPLVSICIPTYNRAAMVGRAIESALLQTYDNLEVIVVDNASTDNIEEVVGSYDDPRLRLVKNSENLGLFGNFNRCIDLYTGSYLHILHSDDYIDRDFTEKCVAFFEANPDVYLTSTSSRTVSESEICENKVSDEDFVLSAPEGFKRLLSERCFISCPSVMARRGLYEEIGKFSLEYPYSSDYYQWLRVSRIHNIGYVSDAWINYTVGDHSESYRLLFKSPLGYMDTLKIYMAVIAELGEEIAGYRFEINLSLRRFVRDCIYAGFMRTDSMDNFDTRVFSGMALCACSLISPNSFKMLAGKISDRITICLCGNLMYFSPVRRAVSRVLKKRKNKY